MSNVTTDSAFGGYIAVAAPGSSVSIFGSNLAGSTRGWPPVDFTGSGAPTSLDGVSVTVNDTPAYVSPAQVPGSMSPPSNPGRAPFVERLESAVTARTCHPYSPFPIWREE